MPDDVNPSFRGILSPFAEDSRPLEEETLPDNDLPDTVAMPSHARTKSGGEPLGSKGSCLWPPGMPVKV